MASHVPDHNDPEVKVSEIKAFTQRYYIVDDDGETGRRTDYELRDARVEVVADEDGVFLECRGGGVTEALSIPTPDLAVSVANYILEAYKPRGDANPAESFSIEQILFLEPEVQKRISHELWRLSNHITNPHGPVDAQGAPELHGHLKAICNLLDIKPAPYPGYPDAYKPTYNRD